ncbi:uncharacterized protein PRCAT00002830001 [Priceomyces carsonii]|uniref:uncharacterized protein n=1 Tax=Priceomyces carsonii TaxID=28549 RepID=UPI002EDA52F5|nr:unnamed protein product [Priceomyces carsonii]
MKLITKRLTSKSYLNYVSERNLLSYSRMYYLKGATSASADEMSHFNALASSWWDVNGPQRILHKMNLLRMDFIHDNIKNYIPLNDPSVPPEEQVYVPPYNLDLLPSTIKNRILEDQEIRREEYLEENKLKVLDVGCGGGILSECMARLSFVDTVKGIDLSTDVIEAAKVHQQKDPLLNKDNGKLSYEITAIEDLPLEDKFDVITMFELLEHVEYPSKVLTEGLERLNEGGWLFLSTINRDPISWFTTIFMGEHVLRIVPVGTHTLEKYIDHDEIKQWIEEDSAMLSKYEVLDSRGCIYVPAYGWTFTCNAKTGNYFMAIRKIN